ncbi:MAG: TonB-dependent receptor [Pseudomonadota bacterium]
MSTFSFRDRGSVPQKNAIVRGLRQARWSVSALAAMSIGTAPTLYAQDVDDLVLEEVLVTAQKRDESLQNVPISIQALDSTRLEQLLVSNFDDYALLLPSLSYNSVGPGTAQIYMRGISDGGDGNPSGSSPSVAVYLDEQPVTAIGRNLDVHIYDIERVEALAGPQGTLYGASSQAGTLRIITKQPSTEEFNAGFDLGYEYTEDGDPSNTVEGFLNIPITDRMALRLVGYRGDYGGYIDNVFQVKTFSRTGVTIDNAGLVEENFNEEKNTGARAALKVDLNDNWTATLNQLYQKQETKGVWDHDPEDIGDLEVARFNKDAGEDEFYQTGLTVEGQMGDLDLVYAGSYLDRDVNYESDYTEYAEYSSYIDYYTCYYAYDYSTYGYVFYDCDDPRIRFTDDSKYKRNTQELRLQQQGDSSLRWVGGLFYEKSTHDYLLEWHIPAIKPGMQIREPDVYFVTDQKRTDTQYAIFGEVTYDLTDSLTTTVGARGFKTESEIKGFVGTVFTASPEVDVDTDEEDVIYKFNLTYNYTDDIMIYGTVSEGFRPGGVNRTSTSNIPGEYESDRLWNYEFGWKTTLLDQRLRFNGAAYYMDWEDIQFTRFDPSESQLGLTANAGDAEVYGIESDVTYLILADWEVSAAFSYNDASLSEEYDRSPTEIIPSGTELPFVPDFKGNISSRYTFSIGETDAFVQAVYAYTGSSYNDLIVEDRAKQDSYEIVNMSAGIERDSWSVTLYGSNLTDERAEIYRNNTDLDDRITTNRPRSYGVRFSMNF